TWLILIEVIKAAQKLDIDAPTIMDVSLWDGKRDLNVILDEDHSMGENNTGRTLEQDTVPAPPNSVTNIYELATPWLRILKQGTQDEGALKELRKLNSLIKGKTQAYYKKYEKESQVPEQLWEIPIDWFAMHYKSLGQQYDILISNPNDENARKNFTGIMDIIHHCIERHHFPQNWGVVFNLVIYPWNTGIAADGSRIIGVRRNGAGHRVCVETKEEGRLIRRIISASKAGLKQVQEYMATEYFNLAGQQSKWTYEDRENFEEVLWVTEAQGGVRNAAANRRNPTVDCCVRMKDGIHILTLSNLYKVLGDGSAKSEIKRVCDRDNISYPWNAKYRAISYDN
ncbi:hypothetical protein B0I35DRAFT_330514, partial [Stachybotrys elegans]